MTGTIDGDAGGKPYRERWSMTFDATTQMLAVIERRAGGIELLSVANWQTPLAIRFTTAPVLEGGRSFQHRLSLAVSMSRRSLCVNFVACRVGVSEPTRRGAS